MTQASPPLITRFKLVVKKRWRAWLRALHRDTGYLLVGLTFVYALSGIALNHIDDRDWNFKTVTNSYEIGPLPNDEARATDRVLKTVGISAPPLDAYIIEGELNIEFADNRRTIRVADIRKGTAIETYSEPRFFFRVANWLHENRGKAAWTYVADGYAILLLFLATSGLFMLKGRKGLWGRGAILLTAGIAIPIAYIQLSGGPSGAKNTQLEVPAVVVDG